MNEASYVQTHSCKCTAQPPCAAAILEFMSDTHIVKPSRPAVPDDQRPKQDAVTLAIASARDKLTRFLPRAVEIIQELAETSENDRVRLAAAESIADRAGLGKASTTNVTVHAEAHEAARREADDLVHRITENQAAIAGGPAHISIEALVVHEGEVEPVEA